MGGAAAAASYTFFKVGESVMQKEQIRGPARTWKKTRTWDKNQRALS
jgi:hypothetical protein